MLTILKLFFIATVTVQLTLAYRILVIFPLPTPSHQKPQQAISRALANAGHDVTVIAPFPIGPLDQPNFHQIDITSFTSIAANASKMASSVESSWDFIPTYFQILKLISDATLGHESIQGLLKDDQTTFDAIIVENLGMSSLHQLAIEFPETALIGVTSMEMWLFGHEQMGNPNHLLLNPGVFWPNLELHELTFIERVKHVYNYLRFRECVSTHFDDQDQILKKYFPDAQLSARELSHRLDMAIEVTSPVMGYIRPLLPNTVQIPFLHVDPPKPLPQDIQEYLDSSIRGLIYVSFGGTIKGTDVGDKLLTILARALEGLKYNVIWKYENDQLPYHPKNVQVQKWTPQNDILAHKNVKLFIFQGGLQSMDEAVTRGVPLIAIPFFSDQDKNAHIVQTLGMGKKLLRKDITVENLRATVTEVINDPKYKTKVEEIRDKAWDRPMKPKDEAVWWIEYAIRNRGSHFLKYKGRDMPFYQYYLLDVIGVAVALIAGLMFIFKQLFGSSKPTQKLTRSKQKKQN